MNTRSADGAASKSDRILTVYDVVDLVRQRPEMHLGDATLTRLYAFLLGYQSAGGVSHLESPLLSRFHIWLERQFGLVPSTAGWCSNLLQLAGGDEHEALKRFFVLLDEYRRNAAGNSLYEVGDQNA